MSVDSLLTVWESMSECFAIEKEAWYSFGNADVSMCSIGLPQRKKSGVYLKLAYLFSIIMNRV